MAWPRASVPLLLALSACPGQTSEPVTASESASSSTTGTVTGSTSSGASDSSTGTTSEAVTTGPPGECTSYPAGDWAACKVNGMTNNSLCGFDAGGGAGTVLCLSPQSGSYNVCGVRDCVDDCDCFAPPTTGTAIPICNTVFGDGGKACVLYCVNGQICPDGMECVSGTCYWPN